MNTTHRTATLAAAVLLSCLSLSACGERTAPAPAAQAGEPAVEQVQKAPSRYRANTCTSSMSEGAFRACVLGLERSTPERRQATACNPGLPESALEACIREWRHDIRGVEPPEPFRHRFE
jgi:hypothetical protein